MIDKPGFYPDVPMADYLGQLTPTPSISGSGLATIDGTSAAHWWAGSYLNPANTERETPATRFGSACHMFVLEGEKAFHAAYRIKPADMNFSTKDGKAWRDSGDTRAIVTFEDYETIKAMALALHAKPKNAALFRDTEREITLVDSTRGIWTKARPDALSRRFKIAVNLKTCEDARPDAIQKALHNYDHYVSAALCVDMLKALTGDDYQYVLVFVEKSAPHESARVMLPPTVLEWGRLRYRRALNIFAECVKSGHWPGYHDQTITADLPPWAEKSLQARHEAGDFTQAAE